MHSAIAHHTLTHAQAVPEQWPLASSPPVYILGTTSYGMEYQLGSAVLAVAPPSSWCPAASLLAGWGEKLKSP